MVKKDSELFKPLVVTAEKYLRAYCDGKQQDDEKAKVALRVLSVYRRILTGCCPNNACKSDYVWYIRMVKTTIKESCHDGLSTGFPVKAFLSSD